MKRLALAIATLALLASPLSASAAGEAVVSAPQQCDKYELAPDGTRRQSFDQVEDTGQLAGLPPRVETGIKRGEQTNFCVAFQNRTGETIDLELAVENVETDATGRPGATPEDLEFGASDWITLAADRVRSLPHGEIAWVGVDVDVPADAVTGSNYASIIATTADATNGDGGAGIRVDTIRSVALQVYFDVAGNRSYDGSIRDVRAPRVIWWDGLKLAELPILDDLRGLGVATIRFDFRNDGNLTNRVGGAIPIEADLGGREVSDLPLDEAFVLRGSTRTYEATWSEDIPIVGRFTPTIELTDSDGNRYTQELDPIWVIPSWWYLLALVAAIAIPLWIRRRNKRRYNDLLERVEAAEARDDLEYDEDSTSWER